MNKMKIKRMDKLIPVSIDFFTTLADACIPPNSGYKIGQLREIISVHHDLMSDKHRKFLYELVSSSDRYKTALSAGDGMIILFDRRFNPDNQYRVRYRVGSFRGTVDCFKHNDLYYMSPREFIPTESIVSIKKQPLT